MGVSSFFSSIFSFYLFCWAVEFMFILNSVGVEWKILSCRFWLVFQLVYELVWAWIWVIYCFWLALIFGVSLFWTGCNLFPRILIKWLFNSYWSSLPVHVIDLQDFIFKVPIFYFTIFCCCKDWFFLCWKTCFFFGKTLFYCFSLD